MNKNENAIDFSGRFFRIHMLMHKDQMRNFTKFGSTGNPHRGQGRVLAILKLHPEISQKELGYLLDISNQALGELLRKLEHSGYITRTPSETDHRTMDIKLTEAGAAAAGSAEDRQDGSSELFNALTDEEQEQLRSLLDKLIESMEQQLGTGGVMRNLGEFWGKRSWGFGLAGHHR
jgi:DNA-binding MarR family transcriptional regulator